MRRLIDLAEQVDEVNYFLNEWQHLKQYKNPRAKSLLGPEVRFISRTLSRLILEAQELDVPLVLTVSSGSERNAPAIRLTECIKFTNESGDRVSYIGNSNGLLSLAKLADMVSRGSRITLMSKI